MDYSSNYRPLRDAAERLAIYVKLLKWLSQQRPAVTYLCWGLSEICDRKDLQFIENGWIVWQAYPFTEFETDFPELWAQRPKDWYGAVWFDAGADWLNVSQRINAVMKAIALVKNGL